MKYEKREALQNLRKQKGYTQEEVAKMLGITRSCYANYEHGRNKIPLEIASKLMRILNYKKLDIFLTANATK